MKAWHSQQPKHRDLTCVSCRDGDCSSCPDAILAALNRGIGCTCARKRHAEALVEAAQITIARVRRPRPATAGG